MPTLATSECLRVKMDISNNILFVKLSFLTETVSALSTCLVVILFWYLSCHISQLITLDGLSSGKNPITKNNVLVVITRKVEKIKW